MFASPLNGTSPLNAEHEILEIVQALQETKGLSLSANVVFKVGVASEESLTKVFRQSRARQCVALHLSAHGSHNGLLLEDPNGALRSLNYSDLSDLCRTTVPNIALLVLGSCNSAALAEDCITKGFKYVVATRSVVHDTLACVFSKNFYYELFLGAPLQQAFDSARCAVSRYQHPRASNDACAFLLLESDGAQPAGTISLADLMLFQGSEFSDEFHPSRPKQLSGFEDGVAFCTVRSKLPPPVEDFVGRKGAMLSVFSILNKWRVCVAHGPSGIGKTALGTEVARFAAAPGRHFSHAVLHLTLRSCGDNLFGKRLLAKLKDLARNIGSELEEDLLIAAPALSPVSGSAVLDTCNQVVEGFVQIERDWRCRPLLVLDDEMDAVRSNEEVGLLLTRLLRETQRLCILVCTTHPIYEPLGAKVRNINLSPLDRDSCAILFLKWVQRFLTEADLEANGDANKACTSFNEGVQWLLTRVPQMLEGLEGNPAKIRHAGSSVVPGGPPLFEMRLGSDE